MIVVGILGDIGSGKSFVSKQFNCPVFNADHEVSKIYSKSKVCYKNLKNKLPKHIKSFPINKAELTKAILANSTGLFLNWDSNLLNPIFLPDSFNFPVTFL